MKSQRLRLTGHTVSPTSFTYTFDAGKHDSPIKNSLPFMEQDHHRVQRSGRRIGGG